MKYKRQDIIENIIDLRIRKGLSNKSIIDNYLKGELGYKQTYSYVLLKEARIKIGEIYKSINENAINESVAQLEQLYEICLLNNNMKQALEIRKELNKLLGLYAAEKMDLNIEFKAKFDE